MGPGIVRLLMARSYIRPAAGAVHDAPETPEDAAGGQGADANDEDTCVVVRREAK